LLAAAVSILSLVVTVLTVAVVALYRQPTVAGGSRNTASSAWPLASLSVGERLPSHLGVGAGYTGFVVLEDGRRGCSTARIAIERLAAAWGESLAVVPVEALERLQPRHLPVVCYLRDGRLVDAAAGVQSPSMAADRFKYSIGPLTELAAR